MTIKNKICEICNSFSNGLDKHHIQSRCCGGENKKYNIVNICCNCHRNVHLGKVIIEGRFNSTKGNVVVWRYEGDDKKIVSEDPKVHIIGEKK